MTIELRPITRENWKQTLKLKVHEDQDGFVAPNVYSIAESRFYPSAEPMGVFADGAMVGFAMWARDDDGTWWFDRLMIDVEQQGKGYGKAAMLESIRLMSAMPECSEIHLCFVPQNTVARRLYTDLGFEDTGRVVEGEIVFRLRV